MADDGKIIQMPPPQKPPPNGGYGERLAVLETKFETLATREDVKDIKIWALTGVILGMVLAASLSLAVLKLFP
ncbi:MAG: hypothetical protein F4092_14875 [Rhodospirillaceae bacterium]|nr:hypothetical protein [Rhodospirillaceae bacterium]